MRYCSMKLASSSFSCVQAVSWCSFGSTVFAAAASVALGFVAPVFLVLVFVVLVVAFVVLCSHCRASSRAITKPLSTQLVADVAAASGLSWSPVSPCLLCCGNGPLSIGLGRSTHSRGCRRSVSMVSVSSSLLLAPSSVLLLAPPDHTHLIVWSARISSYRTRPRHRLAYSYRLL